MESPGRQIEPIQPIERCMYVHVCVCGEGERRCNGRGEGGEGEGSQLKAHIYTYTPLSPLSSSLAWVINLIKVSIHVLETVPSYRMTSKSSLTHGKGNFKRGPLKQLPGQPSRQQPTSLITTIQVHKRTLILKALPFSEGKRV